MYFVELADKLFNESFIKRDVAHVFPRTVFPLHVLSISNYLRLQQKEVLVSDFVL